MSRVLVVYANHHDQACAFAAHIAQRLREDGHVVEVADARAGVHRLPPPEDYDAVVLGSRVELGRHAAAVLDYIRTHRSSLQAIPSGFYSISPVAARQGAGLDPFGRLMRVFGELDWYPSESASFSAPSAPRPSAIHELVHRLAHVEHANDPPASETRAPRPAAIDDAAVNGFADRIADLLADRVRAARPASRHA
jgi:menaquinone-dependent protoporphyrinogen IX oxidase